MSAVIEESSPPTSAASSAESVVAVRSLTKIFKDFWGRPKARAVDDVSFEVKRGEVFGLLGPNGSGKSTTVKMLLGLLYPTKGQISVFGRSPRHVPTKARIGYLPEESYLYRYLDSRETIDFFGSLFEIPNVDRKQRAEQLLEMVGLKNVQRRTVGEFSKGMQRRIGLAQALINDPDLVILDEPTAGMDPIGCREVKDLILALAKRGKTVILSSHLLSDVEDVCDRVVIYYGGRVRAMGTMKELLVKPDTVRFSMPALDKETTERVLGMLREQVRSGEIKVDVPTQNLEAFFLDVVQKAQGGEDTSGATSGHKVAAYLQGDAEAATSSDKVLDRLTSKDEEPPAAVVEPAAPSSEEAAAEKLASLTRSEPEAVDPKPNREEQQPEDLEAADDRLSSLLDDGDDDQKKG